ncbi:MAG: CvpA family protein [Methylococcales bacterium]
MVWVDFTVIGLLAIFLMIGIVRGFNKQFFSFMFWILAIWVGLNFSKEFSFFWGARISYIPARIAASFAGLLVITLIVGTCIRLLLGDVINKAEIGFFGRLGGLIFGFFQGLVVVLLLVILAGLTALPADLWWQESKFLPIFQQIAILLRDHLSSGITEYINYR